MELRAAQRREFIRVRVDLSVGYTPISAEECRQLKGERNQRAAPPWPDLELPKFPPGSESEALLESLRIINDKLDYLLGRLCGAQPRRHQFSATTIDVSGGGLCLAAAEPAPLGEYVDMTLVLPTWPQISLELLGQVQSVDKPEPEEGDAFKIGIGFVALSEIDRDRLVRYIFQKQRECLRHRMKPAQGA